MVLEQTRGQVDDREGDEAVEAKGDRGKYDLINLDPHSGGAHHHRHRCIAVVLHQTAVLTVRHFKEIVKQRTDHV